MIAGYIERLGGDVVDLSLLAQQDRQDAAFFAQHADRQAHIRCPVTKESSGEFWKLGTHDPDRRRILLWRVPAENPYFNPDKQQLLKIPFLAFADETIEDRDDILLPIIAEIMMNVAKQERFR